LLWETATGKELPGPEYGQSVEPLAFSPDSKLLAFATFGARGPARLWDLTKGRERCRLPGLDQGGNALAFSPDGRLLAGAGGWQDNAIHFWEVLTGEEIFRFVGGEFATACLAFAPDGRTLASGGWDSTILLWDVTGSKKEGRAPPGRLTAAQL